MEQTTLAEMWRDAQLRFSDLTGADLVSHAGPVDMQRLVEARLGEMEEKSTGEARKRKDVGLNILSCIKMLGGIAAKGASLVIEPAELCFSAIALLLDVPQKIRDFHELIEEVFVEILSTLSQFKIYARIDLLDKIDQDLKMSIHRVLISFVDICAKCITISRSGRWERFKGHAKRILCEDKELDDELKKLKNLVRGQQYVQNAVSLEVVLGNKQRLVEVLARLSQTEVKMTAVETGVEMLVEAEGTRKQDASKRQQLVHIRNCLGISEHATEGSRAMHEDRVRRSIPGTGQWLESCEPYMSWSNRRNERAPSVLFLSGPPSVGKSFAVSAMIERLMSEKTHSGDPDRSIIAYHFFTMPTGKHDDESRPVTTALKCICVQLAERDAAYAKAIYEMLSRPGADTVIKSADSLSLWRTLRLGAPARGATHYILLDGLDNLPKSSLDQLRDVFRELPGAGSGNHSKLRVLASGDSEAFDPDMQQKGWAVIDMRQQLAEEMRKYVRHELGALFPDQRLAKQKQDIEDRLLSQPCYTFRSILNALDNVRKLIESSGAVEELDQILAKSSRDPKEIAKEEMEKLEEQLNARQITLLNELLSWVVCGRESFGVEQLEAALFLRFKETILEGVDHLIEKRLKKVFVTNPSGRILLADGIKQVVVKEREVPRTVADRPLISLDIKIANADLETVQRFLWDLTRHSTLESFSFRADTMAASQQSPKGHIRANEIDGHLAIVKSTIAFLREPKDAKTQAIGGYLLQCFPQHLEALQNATGLDSVGADDKKMITKCVFDLFDDVEIIKKHWDACSKVTWFKDQAQLAIFLSWLQDGAATSSFSRNDRIWLHEVAQSSNPGRVLLSPVMRMVARLWLRGRVSPAIRCGQWIAGFLRLGVKEASVSVSESSGALDNESSSIADNMKPDEGQIKILPSDSSAIATQKAESWCRIVLGLKQEDLDSIWHERLGDTYASLGLHVQACEQYLSAQALPNPSFTAYLHMASSLGSRGRISEANSILENALKRPEISRTLTEKEFVSSYSYIAEGYALLWRPEQAISACKIALELQPDDGHCRCLLFTYYTKFKRHQDAQELLVAAAKHMCECTTTGRPRSQLAALLDSLVGVEHHRGTVTVAYILGVASQAGFFDTLLHDLETAIDAARMQNRHYERAALLLYHGIARFYRYRSDPSAGNAAADIARALSLWKESFRLAQQYMVQQKCAMTEVCKHVSLFQSWYHFDQLMNTKTSMKSQNPRVVDHETQDHLAKLEELVKTDNKRQGCGCCGSFSPAEAYLASYHAAQGNTAKARETLAAEMNRVLGMLSDGNGRNDLVALSLLHSILLHAGDMDNAVAAVCLMTFSTVPARSVKDILWELTLGSKPQGVPTKEETESAMAITSLCEEQLQATPEDDTLQHIKRVHGKINNLIETSPDNKHYPRIRDTLVAVEDAIASGTYYTCDNCQVAWNFDHSLYACRYCYDVAFCRTCLDALKGTGRKGGRQQQQQMALFCGPNHNWLEMPRWDAKRWADAFGKMARIPRAKGRDQGDGPGGEEGYELLGASAWLSRVVTDWGLKDEEWDLESNIN
ncbi:hypothetical protein QBC34DRAFT_457327 [Podospora aff. communis PSN243]|uniref:Fungal STAND N-terminal Goodbye domain-containing protein n=1 Tax=Podospora aff. communis PSN243 TaxID=3040156 RepID=A0AAV9G3E1_9PEZI|nr:hypothetical protein QBC34DRAFT_457327 [Podospora aff. communis PSN243]